MFYLGHTQHTEWHKDVAKALCAAIVLSCQLYDSHGSRPAFGVLEASFEARESILKGKSSECMHFHLSIADIEEFGTSTGKERGHCRYTRTFSSRFFPQVPLVGAIFAPLCISKTS